ncbi:MAG: hypothetical protein JSV05_00985 [Candidatus Bathyarchaeota archaeon]|nr:MAG: hypothetical protein JSV05_00985 [Candidatus Bathyarchaeota archaeon]
MKYYTIDLKKVKGKGGFKCPKCEIKISPDDETEDTFTILEPVMKENSLAEIVLKCNKCASQIHLIGFDLLEPKN